MTSISDRANKSLTASSFPDLEIQNPLETDPRCNTPTTPPFITSSPIRNHITDEQLVIRQIKKEPETLEQKESETLEQQQRNQHNINQLGAIDSDNARMQTGTEAESLTHLIHYQSHHIITKSNLVCIN